MKQTFRQVKFRQASLEKINMVNNLLESRTDDEVLTLRELYYLLVGQALIPNTIREYQNLGSLLVKARMAGLVDWDVIEDRLRVASRPHGSESAGSLLRAVARGFTLDRQKGQSCYVEAWTEKDALSRTLYKVTAPYHVTLLIDRGYGSCTALYEASLRFAQADIDGKLCTILYVGDHDPSGLNMLEDIQQRLEEFGISDIEIVHVALTTEQIQKYNLPPNPAKISDPRAKRYIQSYGKNSWEVDALKALAPGVLEDLVHEQLIERLDLRKYKAILKQEKQDRKKLQVFADTFNKI